MSGVSDLYADNATTLSATVVGSIIAGARMSKDTIFSPPVAVVIEYVHPESLGPPGNRRPNFPHPHNPQGRLVDVLAHTRPNSANVSFGAIFITPGCFHL